MPKTDKKQEQENIACSENNNANRFEALHDNDKLDEEETQEED